MNKTEQLGEALLASSSDAIVATDRDGRIIFWNPGAERIFGFTQREAVGQSLDLIIPGALRERHWDGYRRVMATGETAYAGRTLAVPAIRADGTRLSVEFTVTLLRDDRDAVVGIAAILRDVTRQFDEQRALRRRVAELERAAADREADPGR